MTPGHPILPLWWRLYRTATALAAPLVQRHLQRRRRLGKEDDARFPERLGIAGLARPPGRLLWVHAASVGEAQSVLALTERILAQRPGLELLLTTGTVTSARLVAARLPARARHQFVPVDLPRAVDRFLDHWRPDLAIWVESELWPNLVLATRRRALGMVLVNGRVSGRTLARWRRLPGLIRPVLGAFDLCLAQDATQATRLRELGAGNIATVGDLKAAAPPLAADPVALAALRRQVGGRPVWLAASTHAGEEELVAAAHQRLAGDHPGLLTIIAPRHPARGPAIAAMLRARSLKIARRSAGEPLAPDTAIYLADTMGELGLFFRAADITFVGGSLVAKGGHNPFEPARLGCVVLHGPDMTNCAALAGALGAAGGSLTVADAAGLAAILSRLFADPSERGERAAAARRVAAEGDAVLDAVLTRLAPFLDRLGPVATPMRPRAAADTIDADARA